MDLRRLFLLGLLIVAPVAHAQEGDEVSFDYYECPMTLPDSEIEEETIDCAYLTVPEDRSDADSPMIDLAVAILYSPADDNDYQADPILYLDGGPGGSALAGIDGWYKSPLRETRDIILLDQRGTGFSQPFLGCFVDEDAEEVDEYQAVQDCRDSLVLEGVNLSAYNSFASVQDIADLRDQLEVDEWNLIGISYGTRLALTAMRDDPTGIRSVIIDSVYPPQVMGYEEQSPLLVRAIEMIFTSCAADADCDAAYPDLENVFYALIDDWNAEPMLAEAEDPDSGEYVETEYSGDDVIDLLSEALYDTEIIPYLPLAIYIAQDDPTYAMELIQYGGPGDDADDEESLTEQDFADSDGMFNSVECYEEMPFNSLDLALEAVDNLPESLREKFAADVESIFATCDIWDIDVADPIETEPVESDIPTLVLAGEFDPVTPPAWAEDAAYYLSNSYYFVFPEVGHGIMGTSDCATSIYEQFLDDPDTEPDSVCIADLAVEFAIE